MVPVFGDQLELTSTKFLLIDHDKHWPAGWILHLIHQNTHSSSHARHKTSRSTRFFKQLHRKAPTLHNPTGNIHVVSWEPEGCYHYQWCSIWEPEGHYHYSKMFRLRTRRELSPYTLNSNSDLLVFNVTSLNIDSALLALNWRYNACDWQHIDLSYECTNADSICMQSLGHSRIV